MRLYQHMAVLCVTVLCSWLSGCATFDKMSLTESDATIMRGNLASDPECEDHCQSTHDVDLERGKRRPLIDGIGWLAGIPQKIVLWDSRAKNHHISYYTQHELVEYMERNHLRDTKVRVNQYDPIGEWKRLVGNEKVGAGWRATFGTLHTLGYTVFPGRIFGNDSYNPYTDTVNIYSDIPALALEQAAFAKDVHEREYPGTYAAVQELPFVGLWHEHKNKQDVYNYYSFYGDMEDQREAHYVLDPQFGSEVGQQIDGALAPGDGLPLFQLTGAAVGHVVGRVKGSQVHDELPRSKPRQPVRLPAPEELPLTAPNKMSLSDE